MSEFLVNKSLARITSLAPPEGYYLAFSGGKDSCVIKKLCDMAKVKYEAVYNVTTIDPPELVRFIKYFHPDVKWSFSKRPFLIEMVYRGFPMRQRRWCCSDYKERGGEGRVVLTGIRWAESSSRSKRQIVEADYGCRGPKGKKLVNPIIDWPDSAVWRFIGKHGLPYCELYDEGWTRLGCVMCPLASPKNRLKEYERYPGFVKAYKVAFGKLYAEKKRRGLKSVDRWKDGDEMFNWWIGKSINSVLGEANGGQS